MKRSRWTAPAFALGLAMCAALVGLNSSRGEGPKAKTPAEPAVMPNGVQAFLPATDATDVLFLHPKGAVTIRLRLAIEGIGVRQVWRDYARRLFVYLDANHDGKITLQEGDPQTIGNRFLNLVRGANRNFGPAMPAFPAQGMNSLADMETYLIKRSPPVRAVINYFIDGRFAQLTRVLDRDGDKALSRRELEEAPLLLDRVDYNEDRLAGVQEITRNPSNPYAGYRGVPSGDTQAWRFFVLGDAPSRRAAAQRWIREYDVASAPKSPAKPEPDVPTKVALYTPNVNVTSVPDPNFKHKGLTRERFLGGERRFDRVDANHDGLADENEIAAYLEHPEPDVEITAGLAKRDLKTAIPMTIAASVSPSAPIPIEVQSLGSSAASIVLGQVRVDLQIQRPGEPGGAVDVRSFYQQQFNFADSDANGYLDDNEAKINGIFSNSNNGTFGKMDRNSDGKLYKEEMNNFLDQYQDEADSRAEIKITDHGHVLFAAIDADGDLALSLRELRKLRDHAKSWDENNDGKVDVSEMPRRFQLTVSQGQLNFDGIIQFGVQAAVMQRVLKPDSNSGPAWFRKMDRNQDGDLSSDEFLGSPEEFRIMDADRDGLIDIREAEAGVNGVRSAKAN